MVYAYDIEIFPNFFSAVFIPIPFKRMNEYIQADLDGDISLKKTILADIDAKVFMVYDNVNQLPALYKFISSDKVSVLVGYNSIHYDNVVIDFILNNRKRLVVPEIATNSLYTLSSNLINYDGHQPFRKEYGIPYSDKYMTLDLMPLHNLRNYGVSLKQVSIALKWYRVKEYIPPPATEEELDMYLLHAKGITSIEQINNLAPWDRLVMDNHVRDILDYNINDVLITIRLHSFSIDEISQRIAGQNKYHIKCLSDSRSRFADKVMVKFYGDATGLNTWDFSNKRSFYKYIRFNDIISSKVEFKSKYLKTMLRELRAVVIEPQETITFSKKVVFNGVEYKLATGGLHSVDHPRVLRKTDKQHIIDCDVTSYYPNIIIKERIRPKHLSPIFVDIVSSMTEERIQAKSKGDKSTSDILKIVINSGTFGKLGFMDNFLYDLKAMYGVTINGQLLLLMLAEDLGEIEGVTVVSANTDGIVSIVYDDSLDEYHRVCTEWQDKLGYNLEFTEYSKLVQTTVNDYMAITTTGYVKQKGDFLTEPDITKGYYHPVVSIAVNNYFKDGTPIEDSIRNHEDIYDFCMAQKVGKQFNVEYHTLKDNQLNIELQQKTNRYFISKSGGTLLKAYKDKSKKISLVSGKYVTLFNNYVEKPMKDYDIDYQWYIAKAMDLVNRISGITTKEMKKSTGKLFDNI